MKDEKPRFTKVDEYIAACSIEVQPILQKLRAVIKKAAPDAVEKISYGMPFYEYGGKGFKGRLIYFASFKKHISLFIIPSLNSILPADIKEYHVSKATYQFPLTKVLPFALIKKTIELIVKARNTENTNLKTSQKIKKKSQNENEDIIRYNDKLEITEKEICKKLFEEISTVLAKAENKVWHGHPVWFIEGNPIVGYSKQKAGIRLMFWSGASFAELGLPVLGQKFKDASIFYKAVSDINLKDLKRWLIKSKKIQWDYKNIVKRKGVLERLK